MTDPFERLTGEEYDSDANEHEQRTLAEIVLASLDMADAMKRHEEIIPTQVQYQVAVSADNIRVPDLSLPASFYGVIEPDSLNLIILTYNFGLPTDRPYLEIYLETEDKTVAIISKPGLDEAMPYNGTIKDYKIQVPAEEVADLIDQIVVPSVDEVPISDPQQPSQARNILDILVQSQKGDIVESRIYDLEIPKSTEHDASVYQIKLHSMNSQLNEIEIETIIEDQLGFDIDTGIPFQNKRLLNATLSFEDFSQSVGFTAISSDGKTEVLENDKGLLDLLGEDISQISNFVDADYTSTVSLDESI